MLSPARGKITHVLLTRAPLYRGRSPFSCDLHVLGAPLTFVLSQDQTLQFISGELLGAPPGGGAEPGSGFSKRRVASVQRATETVARTSRSPGTHSSTLRLCREARPQRFK